MAGVLKIKDPATGIFIPISKIPGPQGPQGEKGNAGPQGDPGAGVPSGGSANQVLVKATSNDYDTAWKTESISITVDGNGDGTLCIERK